MSAVADKLRRARALIDRGWAQGEYVAEAFLSDVIAGDYNGPCHVCATGAIGVAVGDYPDAYAAEELVNKLADAIGVERNIGAIEVWNDTEGRTQAEVLAAFDRAIELALSHPESPSK